MDNGMVQQDFYPDEYSYIIYSSNESNILMAIYDKNELKAKAVKKINKNWYHVQLAEPKQRVTR